MVNGLTILALIALYPILTWIINRTDRKAPAVMPAPKRERLLTNAEAAVLLGLTPRALERLRGAGGGPVHTYVGRFPRYSPRHINAYLAANAKVPQRA